MVVVVVLNCFACALKRFELEVGFATSLLLLGVIGIEAGVLKEHVFVGLAPHLPCCICVTMSKPELEGNLNGVRTIIPLGLKVLNILCPGLVVIVVALLFVVLVCRIALIELLCVGVVEVLAKFIVHGGGDSVTINKVWWVVSVD